MKTFSLTRRIISGVLLVQLCSALVVVVGAGIYEGFSRFHALDVMLRGRADSILGAVQDAEDESDSLMLDGTQASTPRRDIYAVRDEKGKVLGQSANWPSSDQAFEDTSEFRSLTIGRHRYRVLRLVGTRMVDPGVNGGVARHVIILYGSPTHPVWEAIAHALTFYALLSFLLLALTAILMLRLLRAGLKPLRNLAEQAALVSVDAWKFAPSDDVLQVRELSPLANTLAAALNRLERSFEQQRQFVSDAAHELKTSVAVVKSSLQVLLIRNREPEEYRRGIERAEIDCDRMEQLVASMLLLAAIEAKRPDQASQQQIDLNEVLADVVEQFRTAADLSQVRLKLSPAGPANIRGRSDELRVLCSNLVHNAVQHTAAGGEVRVFVHARDGQAELHVEDDGEGIAPDILPHVFDRFFRGDASRSRRTGGTGLGLAISKAIVQSFGGKIDLASELGHGTRVIVVIPLAT